MTHKPSYEELERRVQELENEVLMHTRAEEALRKSEKRYRSLVETSSDWLWEVDANARYVYASPRIRELLGYAPEEAVGRTPFDLMPEEEAQRVGAIFSEIAAKQRPFASLENTNLHRDGRRVVLETSGVPVFGPNGEFMGYRGMDRDITERKQTEEVLLRAKEDWERTFDAVPDLIAVLNKDYRIVRVNKAMAAKLGIIPAECIGLKCYEAVHGTSEPPLYCPHRQLIDDRLEHTAELYEERLGGDFAVSVSPLLGPGGELIGSVHVCHDITERKLAEDALLESEARYRLLAENATDVIWTVDMDMRLTYISPSVTRLLGFTEEEAMARTMQQAYTPAAFEKAMKILAEEIALESAGHGDPNRSRILELELVHKDGNTVLVEGNFSFLRDPAGKAVGILSMARNISERKRAEEEKGMLEAQLLQAQKMEAIGTLAGGIAHDFNNILQPIIGYTEMELNKLSPHDPMREGLKRVLNSSLRARELVKQILAVSRSTHDQQKTPVAISSIIKEALKLLRSTLPTSIEIRQNVQMGVALADPTQIYQVLMNLCTNASHAMDDKGILEIRLSPVDLSESDLADQSIIDLRPGPHLKLSVSDTGAGMDAQTIERIFDPYFTTKEVGKGSGLGLSVVHGIVKRHDGAITVKSEPGKGTAFSVYIPRVDVQSETTMIVDDPLPRGSERILLVDDEQAVVEMGTAILERLGYKVTTETDSLRALEVFSARPEEFDLIITDYTMPNLTGVDLAKEVRLIRPDMLILICTGFSERITPDSLKELGLELLMKPYGMRQISEAVRKILDARKGGGFEKGN